MPVRNDVTSGTRTRWRGLAERLGKQIDQPAAALGVVTSRPGAEDNGNGITTISDFR